LHDKNSNNFQKVLELKQTTLKRKLEVERKYSPASKR